MRNSIRYRNLEKNETEILEMKNSIPQIKTQLKCQLIGSAKDRIRGLKEQRQTRSFTER
jgi:hypothetical protein